MNRLFFGVVGVIAVLPGADRPVEPFGLAFEHVLDDQIAVDGVADRLAQLDIVPRLVFGAHGQEHDLDRAGRKQRRVGRLADALGEMRRNELCDLDLVVEQRSDPLLGLAHDGEDQRVRVLRLGRGMAAVLLEHDALADHQLLELVGTPAPGISAVGVAGAVLLVEILRRDDDPVEQVFEQRGRRLLGDDLHRVPVERDDFLDRSDVLLLLALRVGVDPRDRMHHVLGGKLLAVVLALEAALEVEGPHIVVRLVDLPALRQHADILALAEIVNPETAEHLAPDAVGERYAVGIGVEAGDRLGHADRDLAPGLGVAGAQAENRRAGDRRRHDRRDPS